MLSDAELIAVVLRTGSSERPALAVAEELLRCESLDESTFRRLLAGPAIHEASE